MSDDLQTLLRPLREVESTSDELARVQAAIRDERLERLDRPATALRRGLRLRPLAAAASEYTYLRAEQARSIPRGVSAAG